MYIAGTNFYKSTNGGTSFGTTLNYFGGGKALSMATSWVGTDTIYVGTTPEGSTAAAIWRSLNGGTTWTNISGSAVPNRYPTDLFANPFNAKEVYATFGGFGSAHVLKSTDAGTTWTNITGSLPDVPTQCVMIDPVYPNNIYVGNDLGVYASTNSGTTWGEYRTGMPYSIVFDLAYVPVSRKIRALTHGSGIWERKLTSIPTAVQNESGEMPKEYYLNQNYPNPFNPVTRIDFGVSKQAFVSIIVYDMAGRRVSRLINGNYTPGNYHVMFDAGNLPSGIYAYTMTVNEKTVKTNKLTILK
jgi:hypothetical protein